MEVELLEAQADLLTALVEAARTVPREEQQFEMITMPGGFGTSLASPSSIRGCGMASRRVLAADVHELESYGLLRTDWISNAIQLVVVTGQGFSAYEQLRERPSNPVEAVEEDVRRYLESDAFGVAHPNSSAKLRDAATLLWQSEPGRDLTAVGHKLREAVQQFATEMVVLYKPPDAESDPAKTKARLRAVIQARRSDLGSAKAELLDGLAAYLDGVNAVLQRLEHGDQKPGDSVTWDDARSALFQTGNLLCEYARVLGTI
jgi:hypothetical protein